MDFELTYTNNEFTIVQLLTKVNRLINSVKNVLLIISDFS